MHFLSLVVASAAAAPLGGACGGRVDGDVQGDEDDTGRATTPPSRPRPGGGASNGVSSGCGITRADHDVDESVCELQLASSERYSASGPGCESTVCSWIAISPCQATIDAGDGGTEVDAGPLPDAGDPLRPSEAECAALCASVAPVGAVAAGRSCSLFRRDDGATVLSCGGCGAGRPPRGFVAIEPSVAPTLEAAYLARSAQLEAASIEAFLALHDDLARLGAPHDLLEAVRIAADDEVRHADLLRAEAERRGAIVPETVLYVSRGRSAFELALENAHEGCALETFGAVLARMQAERATDARMRAIMTTIAAEELGHAALSWRVAAWLDEQLDDDERARVDHARRDALAALDVELARANALPALGVPSAADARAALAALRAPLDLGAQALLA